jgi:hypothetical protein
MVPQVRRFHHLMMEGKGTRMAEEEDEGEYVSDSDEDMLNTLLEIAESSTGMKEIK